jgi:hypothetical protein
VLIVHQGNSLNPQRPCGDDVLMGIVTNGQVKISITRPSSQTDCPLDQPYSLYKDTSAAVRADHFRGKIGGHRQLHRLSKSTRCYFNLVAALLELFDKWAEKRYVGRVSKINPDTHWA